MLFLLVLLFLFVKPKSTLIPEENIEELFKEFVRKHNRRYESEKEKEIRFKAFSESIKEINRLNEKYNPNMVFGITHFSDFTPLEIQNYLYSNVNTKEENVKKEYFQPSNLVLPEKFDWREHKPNILNEIQLQGPCNSCWCFCSVASMETGWALKNGELLKLSEQQIIDCDTDMYGCYGGRSEKAIEYVIEAGGIEKDVDYPYKGENEDCKFQSNLTVVQIEKLVYVESENEEAIMEAVYKNGAVPVSLDAGPLLSGLLNYKGGIYSNENCTKTERGHGVAIIGWGKSDEGVKFWIVRNSWGMDWGEDGYFRIVKGVNMCGIETEPNFAIPKKKSH